MMGSKDPTFDPAAVITELLNQEPDGAARFLSGLIVSLAEEGVSQDAIRRAMTTALLTFISGELKGGNPEAWQRVLAILKDAESLAAQLVADESVHH